MRGLSPNGWQLNRQATTTPACDCGEPADHPDTNPDTCTTGGPA